MTGPHIIPDASSRSRVIVNELRTCEVALTVEASGGGTTYMLSGLEALELAAVLTVCARRKKGGAE